MTIMNLSDSDKLERWNAAVSETRDTFKAGAMELWAFRHTLRYLNLTDDEITNEITLIKQEQESERVKTK